MPGKFFNNSSTNHARFAFGFRSTANPRNIDHAKVLMVVQVAATWQEIFEDRHGRILV
jgi:hypothetical protein